MAPKSRRLGSTAERRGSAVFEDASETGDAAIPEGFHTQGARATGIRVPWVPWRAFFLSKSRSPLLSRHMRKYRLAFAVALSGLLAGLGTACSSKSHAPASVAPGAGAGAGADGGAGADAGADWSEAGVGALAPAEALATPVAFAAMSAQMDALPDGGADGGLPTDLSGTFTLSPGSDGVDLSHDRVAVVVGSRVVIEPGGFTCTPAMTCTAGGPAWAFQHIELSKQDATTYTYHVSGA